MIHFFHCKHLFQHNFTSCVQFALRVFISPFLNLDATFKYYGYNRYLGESNFYTCTAGFHCEALKYNCYLIVFPPRNWLTPMKGISKLNSIQMNSNPLPSFFDKICFVLFFVGIASLSSFGLLVERWNIWVIYVSIVTKRLTAQWICR